MAWLLPESLPDDSDGELSLDEEDDEDELSEPVDVDGDVDDSDVEESDVE